MSDKTKIPDEVKTRLKQAEDYWQENYQRGVEDKEFVTVEGAQWGLHEVQKRKDDGKPSLEFNMCRAYCRQQINTQRQNRPQAKVVPVDNGADADKANLIEGLIKDTEEATDAESAYDTAAENAVYGGLGFYRFVTDYVSELSFNQEPKFLPVQNPHAVYIDPLSRALDGSDMTWAIVGDWVSKDDIIEQTGLSQRKAAKVIGVSERVMRNYLSLNPNDYTKCPYPVQFCLECLANKKDSQPIAKIASHKKPLTS